MPYTVSGAVRDVSTGTEQIYRPLQPITLVLANASYSTPITILAGGDGAYAFPATIPEGTYTLSWQGHTPPTNYIFKNPTSASWTITVGSGCSAPGGATCSSGNITGLNFQIYQPHDPWWQTLGLDTRFNSGITNPIPSGAAACNKYASLPGTSTSPGILISNTSPLSLGSGSTSVKGWSVLNEPDIKPVSTQFNSLYVTLKNSGVGITAISTYGKDPSGGTVNGLSCDNATSICTISSTLPKGVYLFDPCKFNNITNFTFDKSTYNTTPCSGTVQLKIADADSNTIGTNKNYIFLVNGDIQIISDIHIPVGSTSLFSSSRDTTIASTVVHATNDSSCGMPGTTDVDGVYSTDRNFIIGSNPSLSCPDTVDKQLIMGGSITANAGKMGGSFQMNRSLCTDNATTPAFRITERPDFLLNAPELFKTTNVIYSELQL
jgi:hypothetical protein